MLIVGVPEFGREALSPTRSQFGRVSREGIHAADNHDKGGNDVVVIYLGEATYRWRDGQPSQNNLHGG